MDLLHYHHALLLSHFTSLQLAYVQAAGRKTAGIEPHLVVPSGLMGLYQHPYYAPLHIVQN